MCWCAFQLTFFPVSFVLASLWPSSHHWNVSISVEKNVTFTHFKSLYMIWFFLLLFQYVMLVHFLFSSLWLHHLHLANCFCWHSKDTRSLGFYILFLVKNKWIVFGNMNKFSMEKNNKRSKHEIIERRLMVDGVFDWEREREQIYSNNTFTIRIH